MPDVLVTRPEGQAKSLMEALQKAGFRAVHLPLLRIEALPFSAPAEIPQIVIVTSPNAASAIADTLVTWQRRAAMQVIAVGSKTGDILQRSGVCDVQIPERMQSEGILAMPALAQSDKSILIVKGVGGRGLLEDALSGRGHRLSTLDVYRRLPPEEQVTQEIGKYLSSDYVWLLSSGEAMQCLAPFVAGGILQCIVSSQRLAQQAEAMGGRVIAISENATDQAFIKTLCQCLQP